MKTIRWGIIGSGGIATLWLTGAKQVANTRLVAIASRNKKTAQALADRFGIEEVEESYESMLSRDDIDVIYVATPHTMHCEQTLLALSYGKHVLCEKPMGINAKEEAQMFAMAKEKNLFLMEATWMRFFPMMQALRDEIASGSIGEVRSIRSTFSYRMDGVSKEHRALNPMLGGGGLLDVGVYCLHFCEALLGANPLEVHSMASINTDENQYGVDEQVNIIARYPGDILSFMACAVMTEMGENAVIFGTKGKIELPVFWKPTTYTLTNETGSRTVSMPVANPVDGFEDVGYQYEIIHVNQCLRDGIMESPEMTHQISTDIMMLCDDMRKQWELVYPQEK